MTANDLNNNTPRPNHGNRYMVKYQSRNGQSGSFEFTFNGFEFGDAYTQGFHEASVNSLEEHGSVLKSVAVFPARMVKNNSTGN